MSSPTLGASGDPLESIPHHEARTGYARYYPVARTAHLERLEAFLPGDFLYARHRADWDAELASAIPQVHRASLAKVAWRVIAGRYSTLEIPEPLALPLLPHCVVLALAVRLRRAFGRSPVRLVSYAIENLDQTQKLADRTNMPTFVARYLISACLWVVLPAVQRLAFGTTGARDTYSEQLGRYWRYFESRSATQIFEALPAAEEKSEGRQSGQVCFLGSFEERKGIHRVMASWPAVRSLAPDATLVIVGHGELQADVQQFAMANPESVTLKISPSREEIAATLRACHCLVLPSLRTPTWREQVGLPIVEALAAGCEVVTSDETGLASWLAANGHQVLPSQFTDTDLAERVVAALGSPRDADDVKASLPLQDSRVAADRWMFTSRVPDAASQDSAR